MIQLSRKGEDTMRFFPLVLLLATDPATSCNAQFCKDCACHLCPNISPNGNCPKLFFIDDVKAKSQDEAKQFCLGVNDQWTRIKEEWKQSGVPITMPPGVFDTCCKKEWMQKT